MDNKDLLYTNKFSKENVLTNEQIKNNAINALPFNKIKNDTINNVKDSLINTTNSNNSLNQLQYKSEGWNKGTFATQNPILSNFTNDIAKNSYFNYVKTYVNIDSRLRDSSKYLNPNNYLLYLNKNFKNVTNIRITDYNFPNFLLPINNKNNNITFFIPPNDSLIQIPIENTKLINQFICNNTKKYKPDGLINGNLPYCVKNKTTEKYSFYNCFEAIKMNNINDKILATLKSIYSINIPIGNYTVNQLKNELEKQINNLQFYNSNYLNQKDYPMNSSGGYPSELNTPIKFTVDINTTTQNIRYLIRYEELKVKNIEVNKGNNFFTLELVNNNDANLIQNNRFLPIIITELLNNIGGLNKDLINFVEFLTEEEYQYYYELGNTISGTPIKYNYYKYDSNEGKYIFYFYNKFYQEIIFSNSETVVFDFFNAPVLGRSAPFYFIYDLTSAFFNISDYFKKYDKNYLSDDLLAIIKQTIFNHDNSSKSLVVFLGYPQYYNNIAIIGGLLPVHSINSNLDYTNYNLQNWFIPFYLLKNLVSLDYICDEYIPPNDNFFNIFFNRNKIPSKYLPIFLHENGEFFFKSDDYVFLKLSTSNTNNNNVSGFYEQAVSNSSTTTINKLYEDESNNYGNVIMNNKKDIYMTDNSNLKNKDLNNIFTQFKISQKFGNNTENLIFTNIEFFNKTILNLDSLFIQFVNYQGEILDLKSEHSFTLEITEKLEILKETNINSRTGAVNMNQK